ncbi:MULTISPECIES: hypothetical protein [Bradyrhizobium]|uniref:hypothetical protein n=1 Tax=Bradyrhizobium TaxID=374 RepID=UPI0012D2AF5A|nr:MULTISPECIES: hypothetical protein [Bradyrhizobium]
MAFDPQRKMRGCGLLEQCAAAMSRRDRVGVAWFVDAARAPVRRKIVRRLDAAR